MPDFSYPSTQIINILAAFLQLRTKIKYDWMVIDREHAIADLNHVTVFLIR